MNPHPGLRRWWLSALLLAGTPLFATPRLHPLFSDGAVLQRDQPVNVWGRADPGERVVVRFAGQENTTLAGPDGHWSVVLTPLAASATPQVLTAEGRGQDVANDILVGDVWLASGQSNMNAELWAGVSAQALPEAQDPLLHFFIVKKTISAVPLSQPAGGAWTAATPTDARNFSAVAYFFAHEIRAAQQVPVAVIQASWGGTPIKTWMSLSSLRAAPRLESTVREWETALERHEALRGNPAAQEEYYRTMRRWEQEVDAPYRVALKAHPEAVTAARTRGEPAPPAPRRASPEPVAPDPIAMPAASKRPSTPTITYNGMIAPVIPYTLRGVIWYQGEADDQRATEYRVWLPRLIEGWRRDWQQPQLPFLFVQLPAFGRDEPGTGSSPAIAWFREAQASALQLPGTGMAVTVDIGDPDNVHPDNKRHVGHRLALLARQRVYGEPVAGTSPSLRGFTREGAGIRIHFADAPSGLVVAEAPWRAPAAPAVPTDRVVGFELADENRQWVPALARIEGDSVWVSSPEIKSPVAVRYGWAKSPLLNLCSAAGLPVAPFRTDDWPP